MRIYRLENVEGEGCYGRGYGFICSRAAMTGDQTAVHPSPEDDDKLASWWTGAKLSHPKRRHWTSFYSERRQWQCAFESMESLLEWFPKDGLELMKAKAEKNKDIMHLVVYELPHHKVKRGTFQVLYHEPSKVEVERFSLAEVIHGL